VKNVHLLGIEGVGMSALAEVLLAEGHAVSGCDRRPGQNARRLAAKGVRILSGHDAGHLEGVDRLVVTNAAGEDHPEVRAARARGVPVQKRIQALAELLSRRASLGVSGTHGKTTTTAMLGLILEAAGLDPVVLVGARVPQFGGGARTGRGPIVAEIDESDRLFPEAGVELAVLTNLEDDHVGDPRRPTYHPDLPALKAAVRAWLEKASTVVYNADWPGLAELLPAGVRALGFGLEKGALRGVDVVLRPKGSRFVLVEEEQRLGPIELSVPGRHNVENALAAAAAARAFGVEFSAIAAGLDRFGGTGRRLERLGRYRGALLLDDYAHHPTELRATLEAARPLGKRLRVAFQPHRYLRTARFFEDFARVLSLADEAVVVEVYAAGEPPIEGVDHARLAARARELGANARALSLEEALDYLGATAAPGDVILSIGAGDVWRLTHALAKRGRNAG